MGILDLAFWFALIDGEFADALEEVPDNIFVGEPEKDVWAEVKDVRSEVSGCESLLLAHNVNLFGVFVKELDLECWKLLRILSRRHKVLVDVCEKGRFCEM